MKTIFTQGQKWGVILGLSVWLAGAAGPLHAEEAEPLEEAVRGGRAKNVILLVGDGLGDQQITMGRNYHVGAAGRLAMDALPFTGALTTFAVQEADPALPNYVTDSAASGTAWATGVKTSNGRISTTPLTDQDLQTILELAQERGMRTGIVTTSELSDATPAVLAAHVNRRSCQGPADMAPCPQDAKNAGGPGSISEQMVDHHVDVLLGGGKRRFDQTITGGPHAGQTVIQSAEAQGYRAVFTSAELAAAGPDRKLLGLFNSGNMSLEWDGEPAVPFPGSGPQRCLEDRRPENEPSLAEMTRKAISLLDRGDDRPGFFLQVEGASIDKRDHAANPCQQIGEVIGFDRAVRAALDYARLHPDTLVIVTADHAHTAQIIPTPVEPDHPGAFSRLITADGAEMTIQYGTSPFGRSQDHTGAQVRVAAKGPQGFRLLGVQDHIDLFHVMARALGLESAQ